LAIGITTAGVSRDRKEMFAIDRGGSDLPLETPTVTDVNFGRRFVDNVC